MSAGAAKCASDNWPSGPAIWSAFPGKRVLTRRAMKGRRNFGTWFLSTSLVTCPRNTRYFVAIKWATGKAVRAGLAVGGSISEPIRDRRTTQPPAHFHRNPLGRGQLAVFSRCSLDPYDSDMGAFPPVRLGPP